MRTKVYEELLRLAPLMDDHPIIHAINNSTEQGIVVLSILHKELDAAGYVRTSGMLKTLYEVKVHDPDGELVAYGASHDDNDALLQAMWGFVREEAGRRVEAAEA